MLGRSHVPASICLALLLLAGCGDRSKRVGSSEEVLAPQEISYQVLAPYFLDLPIIPLAPSIEGGSPTTWSCEPELTEGLTINGSSGVISGTPTIISPSTEYLITASNSAGTTTFLLTLSVIVQPPCALGYTDPSPIYQLGITIAPNLPFTSCGEATSWTVVPELPGGLFLDGGTGTISGIPGQLTAPTEHLVEAFNSTGSSQTIVTITVVDEPPCALTYPQNEMLLELGEVLPEQTPSVGCGEVEGYSAQQNRMASSEVLRMKNESNRTGDPPRISETAPNEIQQAPSPGKQPRNLTSYLNAAVTKVRNGGPIATYCTDLLTKVYPCPVSSAGGICQPSGTVPPGAETIRVGQYSPECPRCHRKPWPCDGCRNKKAKKCSITG